MLPGSELLFNNSTEGPVSEHDFNGKDLVGWRVVTWYELQLSTTTINQYTSGGFFSNKDLALTVGKGKGWLNADGIVKPVLVLTKDGEMGYILGDEPTLRTNEADILAERIKLAKAKLSLEEISLLGLKA